MDSNGSEMFCNVGECGLRGGTVSGRSGWVMVLVDGRRSCSSSM
jgi:hypothetical protein